MDDRAALTPEGALERVAVVAGIRSSLRSRFEGITWVLWGFVVALQAMTLGFVVAAGVPESRAAAHLVGLGTHLWVVVGIAASVGVWRAAAVNFDPGIGRKRALAFFIGWPALFALLSYFVTQMAEGVVGFAIVTALLLSAFAAVNPVRFTPRGRWTAGVLAVVAAIASLGLWASGAAGPAWYAIAGTAIGMSWYAIAGTAIGMSWVVAGLVSLYQG